MPNRVNELVDGLVVALLLVEEVTPSLVDFCSHLGRELRCVCNVESFLVEAHLHECLDLNVVFHLVQLAQHFLSPIPDDVLSQVEDTFFLDFDLKDFVVFVVPEESNVVYKVLDEEL